MGSPITPAQLFDLEQIETNRFRSRYSQTNHTDALFGGQFIAQALAAAIRTTPGKTAHSLHGYFLRPGAAGSPIDYQVALLRDGQRVATRRVSAFQNSKLVFELLCSFAVPLAGFEHQAPAPDGIEGPEGLASLAEYVVANAPALSPLSVANYSAPFPLQLRLIEPERCFFELLPEPKRALWLRVPSAAEVDDAALHQCLLAFASDYWLLGVAAGAHALPTNRGTLQILSLDHAMWFHRPVRADGWLLYVTDSPSAQQGRGLARGLLYDTAGTLVATVAQEGLLLPNAPPIQEPEGAPA
jgi:acyl-CoA thioesterase-2